MATHKYAYMQLESTGWITYIAVPDPRMLASMKQMVPASCISKLNMKCDCPGRKPCSEVPMEMRTQRPRLRHRRTHLPVPAVSVWSESWNVQYSADGSTLNTQDCHSRIDMRTYSGKMSEVRSTLFLASMHLFCQTLGEVKFEPDMYVRTKTRMTRMRVQHTNYVPTTYVFAHKNSTFSNATYCRRSSEIPIWWEWACITPNERSKQEACSPCHFPRPFPRSCGGEIDDLVQFDGRVRRVRRTPWREARCHASGRQDGHPALSVFVFVKQSRAWRLLDC